MEYTKNKLPDCKIHFFTKLKEYLNTKIYYYGSVQRYDFFDESDIDIDIFTINEFSTINQICNFLNYDKNEVKHFIWKLDINGQVVQGYKLLYHDQPNNFYVDISIFNEKYKQNILQDQLSSNNLPFYSIFFLLILKIIYYKIHLIDWATYSYLKKKIIITGLGLTDDGEFIIIGEDRVKRIPFGNLFSFFN
uniref:Polymerase nucleotidyl transferase domain-containing protein n=1 Tax=viral metagenome TaxID=1070528 RepID=A0A6C0HZ54_9ZZZZ